MKGGFTLIELLLVVAVIVALAVTVFVALNPAQRLAEARDAKRISDMSSLQNALNLYTNDIAFAGQVPSFGISSTIYISVPDPTATTTLGTNCAGLGLTGSYHCAASSTYQQTNGTGWIPVNFAATAAPSLSQLPIDPVNTTSSGEYYEYATDGSSNWEVLASPESTFSQSSSPSFAGGTSMNLIARSAGSSNNPVPTLISISPNSSHICLSSCTGTTPLAVTGTGFVSSSVVYWDSSWVTSTLATAYISSSSMTAQIPIWPELSAQGGTASITVISPAPGGGTSGVQYYTVTGVGLPPP